jgi:hypothetical protein
LSPQIGPPWIASSPFTPSFANVTTFGEPNHQLTFSSLPGSGVPWVSADILSVQPVRMSFDMHISPNADFLAAAYILTPELTTGLFITGLCFETD